MRKLSRGRLYPVPRQRQHAPRERNGSSVGRLKSFRRVATRYEKLEANCPTMVTLAALVS